MDECMIEDHRMEDRHRYTSYTYDLRCGTFFALNLGKICQNFGKIWQKIGQKVANFVPNGRIIKRQLFCPIFDPPWAADLAQGGAIGGSGGWYIGWLGPVYRPSPGPSYGSRAKNQRSILGSIL